MISPVKKLSHVSEDGIHQLVDASYIKLRIDPELASVSRGRILDSLQPELAMIYGIWPSVRLVSGRYKVNPVAKHRVIEGTQRLLLERWLASFDETFDELFGNRLREAFQVKTVHIAQSLKLALFYQPHQPWPPEPAI